MLLCFGFGMLEGIVASAWAEWDRARKDRYDRVCVSEQSAPLLWFGDLDAYQRSPRKVVTLGVNPGPKTFPPENPWVNCPLFDSPDVDRRSAGTMKAACNAYPLDRWFSWWKPLIQPLTAGGTSLHVDLTPLATSTVFSLLNGRTKVRLRTNGIPILIDLLAYLKPDYTVACLSGGNFKPLQSQAGLVMGEQFSDLEVWRCTWGHSGKFLWVRKTNELPVPHKGEVKLEIGRWAASWS